MTNDKEIMEGRDVEKNNFAKYSRGITVAFAVSLLASTYLVFTLPADLKFKGNIQYLDSVMPILATLYISLGVTAMLACTALYAEMKNTKVAIVYKEKRDVQAANERVQAEATQLTSLDSGSITGTDLNAILSESLNLLSKKLNAVSGACYAIKEKDSLKFAELVSGYALPVSEAEVVRFNFGEGLIGQAAKSGSPIFVDEIPEGYITAFSGLGQASPRFIAIFPLAKHDEVKGLLEVATFKAISDREKQMVKRFMEEIGAKINA
jgi:GAF domain-containing protein